MKQRSVPNAGMVVFVGYSDEVDLSEKLDELDPFFYREDWGWGWNNTQPYAIFKKWGRWFTWHPWSVGDDTDYSLFDKMALLEGKDFCKANKLVERGYTRDSAAMKLICDDEQKWDRIEKREQRAEW